LALLSIFGIDPEAEALKEEQNAVQQMAEAGRLKNQQR
jgi:hypothetical protein